MGFHEDDRIRNKNRAVNLAYALYDKYKESKLSDCDILQKLDEDKTLSSTVVDEVRKIVSSKSSKT